MSTNRSNFQHQFCISNFKSPIIAFPTRNHNSPYMVPANYVLSLIHSFCCPFVDLSISIYWYRWLWQELLHTSNHSANNWVSLARSQLLQYCLPVKIHVETQHLRDCLSAIHSKSSNHLKADCFTHINHMYVNHWGRWTGFGPYIVRGHYKKSYLFYGQA